MLSSCVWTIFQDFLEARAEKCENFRWFFGLWEDKIICFRYLLSFLKLSPSTEITLSKNQQRTKLILLQCSTIYCLSETPSFGKDKSFAWFDWLWYENHASRKNYKGKRRFSKTHWYLVSLCQLITFLKNIILLIVFNRLEDLKTNLSSVK